jgi:sulfonate transport system substrate-binding protein
MHRRDMLTLLFSALASGSLGASAQPAAERLPKEFRIGYQKNGVPVIARQQSALERRLAPQGVAVKWVEFSSGPPLLEAVNAGSVDIGATGDTPPIFAQAAGAAIVYVAGQPTTNGQGILVRAESGIHSLGDLRGRRIGFTKGSSAHNVTIVALEKAGLGYGDITPVYLTPPDAAAAFTHGSIDAWAIWDPYFAIGQSHGGRILVEAGEIVKTNSFYLGNRLAVARAPRLFRDAIDALSETARWAEANRDKVARAMAEVTGVDLEVATVAANRLSFAIGKVTEDIVATQQAVADRFYRLGLIPRPIAIRDAVWAFPQS